MGLERAGALVAGFALDIALGDPHNWPHPVRLIGKQIDFGNRLIDDYLKTKEDQLTPSQKKALNKRAGVLLAADVALVAPVATALVLKACRSIHPALGFGVESFIFYQLIAAKSLEDESTNVYNALVNGSLEQARKAVSMIVGRDTDALDEQGVARATVETIAENASDGVVAPMLYMAIGGAPGAMAYKAVNTLDSMVGYKNERFIDRGWASAKLDDIANIVPARVAGVLMCAGARIAGFDPLRAWTTFVRDRYNHSSPNSAHTEAACAGALGLQLGGPNVYFGKVVDKPTIGTATREIEVEDIRRTNQLMRATAILAVGLSAGIALLSKSAFKR